MVTATIETPKVYGAIANVLKHMSVEKNGTLPGNMGGKAYIPAPAISEEVKRQFVANNLILLPSETVVRHENLTINNRLQVAVVVTGEYTILHTEDGSSVTVSGTGDGLATGTAVSSNIASTNALKNALLRTFLISENSVEDASHAEIDTKPTAAQSKIDKARVGAARPAAKKVAEVAGKSLSDAKAEIKSEWIDKGVVTSEQVNAVVKEVQATGVSGAAVFDAVLARLAEGDFE